MKALIAVADLLLWFLLGVPSLALWVTVRGLEWLLKGCYYSTVRLRRRLKGEPLYQPHDRLLGIGPDDWS